MRKHRSVFVIFILAFELNSDAIKKLQGDNKELLIKFRCCMSDLYCKMDAILFDKDRSFLYEVSEIKSGGYHTRVYDSLTFFHKSAGKTDIERGIRVLRLCGKLVCHL